MSEEVKRATVILDPDNWTTPVLGTPNQHRVLVKKLQDLGYKSIRDALNDWPRAGEINLNTDTVDTKDAHRLFGYLRSDRFFYGRARNTSPKRSGD